MKWRWHTFGFWLARLLALACAIGVVLFIEHTSPQTFKRLENTLSDLVWQYGANSEPEARIILVDIDEHSLNHIGAWPWSRDRLAQLSERLAKLGANLQIFDLVFPYPSASDAEFLAQLQKNHAVLAQVFAIDQGEATEAGELSGAVSGIDCERSIFPRAHGFIANAPNFASIASGHISPKIDADGMVRRMPAVVCFGQQAYPNLALAALLQAAKLPPKLKLSAGKSSRDAPYILEIPDYPAIQLPLDHEGHLRIAYRQKPDAFFSVSARDILENRAPADIFQGAWVIIGSTALSVGDAVPTPHGGAVGGLSVHASILSAMLDEKTPSLYQEFTPLHWPWLLLAFNFLFIASGKKQRQAWILPLLSVCFALAIYGLFAWFLLERQLYIPWAATATAVLLGGTFLMMVTQLGLSFERDRLWLNLRSYLSAPVAEKIAHSKPKDKIDAKKQQVLVLFADLRNFSAFCEVQAPEKSAAVLHDFFTTAQNIISEHGGAIESIQGDAVLAVWHHDATAQSALDAAKALYLAMNPKLEAWDTACAELNISPLALGLGLEAGEALVGSFGAASRRHFATLGTPISVAIRLQQLSSELASPILIGGEMAAQLSTEDLQSQGTFLLEGLRQAHAVFAPSQRLGAS